MSRRKQSNPQHVHNHDDDFIETHKSKKTKYMTRLQDESPKDQHLESAPTTNTNELDYKYSDSSQSSGEPGSPLPNRINVERKFGCSRCGVAFLQRSSLEVHQENYCTGQRYKLECKICGAKFSDKDMFEMHMEVHSWKFTCHLCQTQYETQESYDRHFAVHVTKPNGSCKICTYKSLSPEDMTKHLKVHRNYSGNHFPTDCKNASQGKVKEDLPCATEREETGDACVQSSKAITKVKPPEKSNEPKEGSFTCIVCSVCFDEVDSLQQHLLNVHASNQPKKAVMKPKEASIPNFRRHSIAVNRIEPEISSSPHHSAVGIKRKFSDVEQRNIPARRNDMFLKFAQENSSRNEGVLMGRPIIRYPGTNNHVSPERYRCTDCDISFESLNNFRVHKKYYCSERRVIMKESEINRANKNPAKKKRASKAGSQEGESMHHEPDEDKQTSPESSVKSTKETEQRPLRKTPARHSRKVKKYECKECSIRFSKFDTYLAHKKYYCESRRSEKSTGKHPHVIPHDKSSESSSDADTHPVDRNSLGTNRSPFQEPLRHDLLPDFPFPYPDIHMMLGDPNQVSALLTPLVKLYISSMKYNMLQSERKVGNRRVPNLDNDSVTRDDAAGHSPRARSDNPSVKLRPIKTEKNEDELVRSAAPTETSRAENVHSLKTLNPSIIQFPVSIKQEAVTTI
uniref:zinc finger protein ZF(C2H2)-129 isoform X2 n=1 Tax=Ciona intestinalis TaxID=7719 RepID=UPI00089DCE88|nr:zinc finger protein ZF(C2H2)-129 isoform X2 [Ciona intestinalis]|eukprot:XP_018669111.1 zinc finger protein ZF(C2H2)-129 isoform X2 [Ciona intestinalis]